MKRVLTLMLLAAVAALVPGTVEGQAQPSTMTAKEQANLKHVTSWWLE